MKGGVSLVALDARIAQIIRSTVHVTRCVISSAQWMAVYAIAVSISGWTT